MSINGRIAVVTGTSRGIGKAIAECLVARGDRVVGLARQPVWERAPERYTPWAVDFSKLAELPDRLKELATAQPELDTVIANAGIGRFGGFEQFSAAQIETMIAVNFTAPLLLIRALLPVIKRNGGGDIVLIGSEAALDAGRRGAVYSATKAAVRSFAQALRGECASSATRVTVINPGPVRSHFFDQLSFEPGEREENALRPADVAKAVEYVLMQSPSVVVDEINLTPLKKVWRFNKTD